MKRKTPIYFFTILVFLFVFSLIGFGEEEYTFRKTRWGMSKEEVKQSEGREPTYEEEDGMAYTGEKIADLEVCLFYYFLEDKLYRAAYQVTEKHAFENKYIEDYKKLKELLMKKYGEPFVDREIWENDLYKDDPERWGFAISIGHLKYVAGWATDSTEIGLMLAGDNYEINLMILYQSK